MAKKTPTDSAGSTPEERSSPSAEHALIPICNIDVGDQLIRRDIDEDGLRELTLDIARNGLLQPIGVMESGHGRYQLLWGYRRMRAHKALRRHHIAAQIYPAGSRDVRQTAVRENVHRLSMSLAEECDVVALLTDKDGLSPDSIAAQLGKSRAWVMRRLAVPSLPIDVRDALLEDRITLAAAEAIAQLHDIDARAYAMNYTVQNRWTQRQVEECVAQMRLVPDVSEAVEAGVNAAASAGRPAEMLMRCQGCGDPTPLIEVQVIRTCRGCAEIILEHHVLRAGSAGEGEDNG